MSQHIPMLCDAHAARAWAYMRGYVRASDAPAAEVMVAALDKMAGPCTERQEPFCELSAWHQGAQ